MNLYINPKISIVIFVKRLYKSTSDVKIFGICAGIADYINIDPTVVRVVYLTITIFSGIIPGAVTYLLLAWIVPQKEQE